MNHWIVGFLLWNLAGIVYGIALGFGMFGHYVRKYGVDVTLRALDELETIWDKSWSYVPLNLLLWPYRLTVNAIGVKHDFDNWFEANVQPKKVE